MTGDLLINGEDAYGMGVAMSDDFLGSLLAPASLKDFVENNDPSKNGKEIIYPETPKLAPRDLTLTFTIFGDTASDHLAKYKNFVALLQKGAVVISVPELGPEVYRLTYGGSSGNYMLDHSRRTSKLTVKFNEPDPANRTAGK